MKYELNTCIARRLRKISRIVDAQFRVVLKAYQVSEHQLSILFFLYNTKQIEQGKIGKRMFLERSTVSRNVQLLVQRGWIEKSKDYQPLVALTPQGTTLVKELIPKWEAVMEQLCQQIGEEGVLAVRILENKLR